MAQFSDDSSRDDDDDADNCDVDVRDVDLGDCRTDKLLRAVSCRQHLIMILNI